MDIRAHYVTSQRSVYSDPNWFTIFGDWSNVGRYPDNDNMKIAVTKPSSYSISGYPNPFNPTTKLNFSVKEKSFVQILIFDINGRMIQTLLGDVKDPGSYSIEWNAKSSGNSSASSGVYFVKYTALPAEGGTPFSSTIKIVLLK